MINLNINFEGITFIAVIINTNTIRITNEMVKPVNEQMFFHIKESLIREIVSGVYGKEIDAAIKNKKGLLLL
jgi:ribosomal protein L12E/L44/L45/RPP1/RPP2